MTSKGKIVLYHPQTANQAKGLTAGAHVVPLSLLTIAGWPHQEGYEVIIIDGALYPDAERAHGAVLEACDGALIYGTTGMVGYGLTDGTLCSQKVRERYPKIATIIGGWFASVMPKMELETGLYDAVCMGQGELTFLDFVHAVAAGESIDEIPGLALLREGELVLTPPRKIAKWTELLNCPWDLLDFEPYRQAQLDTRGMRVTERQPRPRSFTEDRPVVTMTYHGSFGCPEPCAFCCSPGVTNRRWQGMPPERMVDDIAEINERFDFDVLRFFDANWGVNERRVRGFCESAVERDLGITFMALMEPHSILRYDPTTVDLMAEAGCYVVNIGAETGSDELMEKIGKLTRGDDNMNSVVELANRGIDSYLTYIIGFPYETREEMFATIEQSRRVAAATPLAHPWIWIYQPIPGTPMYEQSLEQGFIPPDDLFGWGEFGEYHISPSWPDRIPPDVMHRRQLYQHFFTLAHGLTRGKVGWWEKRAQRRLQRDDWRRGARFEAKIFDLYFKLAR